MSIITGEKLQEIADISIITEDIHRFHSSVDTTSCDLCIFEGNGHNLVIKGDDNLDRVKRANVIFVYTHLLNSFFMKIYPSLSSPFILMSHNSDDGIDERFEPYLNEGKIFRWFGQNVAIINDKLISLPIGVANSQWPHGQVDILKSVMDQNVRKEKWVYMNFNTRTNPGGRLPILNRFKDAPYITVAGNMGFRDYLQELARHVFCISPPGNGLDCHRIWECLYLGVIPIVLKNPNIRYYDDLPILLIDDWKEINPEFLEEEFRIFKTRAFNLEKLDLAYWKKEVYSQKGKLRVPDRSEVKRLVYKPQDYDGQLREPELQEMAGAARDEKAYPIVQKLIKDGREKEAIGALKMFLISYPEYALAYNDLGVLYRNNGNKEKALKHYKQATLLDPENTTFQKNLADSYYLDEGYIEEALRIYLALLEKDPVDTETLLILGQICVSLEKFDDAAVFYNKVIELEPLNEHARGKLDSILNNNSHGIQNLTFQLVQ